jgi:hypothetical protein
MQMLERAQSSTNFFVCLRAKWRPAMQGDGLACAPIFLAATQTRAVLGTMRGGGGLGEARERAKRWHRLCAMEN